ncbi:MAG: hypothetical protein KME35_14610 [Aphanocapsa sp. GSE-SYN-MK-11-07L]|jgi:hypothetical protein|nr:hypothetical protein [Aphanocapsa sp. GSE-SYN-MK-11-07L]
MSFYRFSTGLTCLWILGLPATSFAQSMTPVPNSQRYEPTEQTLGVIAPQGKARLIQPVTNGQSDKPQGQVTLETKTPKLIPPTVNAPPLEEIKTTSVAEVVARQILTLASLPTQLTPGITPVPNSSVVSSSPADQQPAADTSLSSSTPAQQLPGETGAIQAQTETPANQSPEGVPPAPDSPVTPDSTAPAAPDSPTDSKVEEFKLTPLQQPPIRLFNLETANQLPAGGLYFSGGIRNFPKESQVSRGGSGREVFYFGVDGGVTDKLQLGLSFSFYDDPLGRTVQGLTTQEFSFVGIAPNFKYQLLKQKHLTLAVSGSVEYLSIRTGSGVFTTDLDPRNTTTNATIAGSLKFPITYSFNSKLQLHFTPAIAFFPETFNDASFYGTGFYLGTGLSWQPLQRLGFFADLNLPLGPGGNTISSDSGEIIKQPVWSVGTRYLINPAVGLNLYATNAFGATPASQLLAYLPDGDQVALVAGLTFTPDIGQNYQASFRSGPRVPLTERDRQLLLEGLTLTSANTLLPGMLRFRAGIGSGTGFGFAYGIANDAQLEVSGEQLGPGVDLIESINYSADFTISLATKLRFLDQTQGDPFSLAIKAAYAQGIVTREGRSRTSGFIELPFTYQPIPQLALFLNPKVGLISFTTPVGVGLGINYQIWEGLQFIGEFTPLITGEQSVWSAGFRYVIPKLNLGFDLYGSNAAGQNTPVGGLVAQEDPTVGFNIHWLFGGSQKP